ncbi:hypothetical protein [Acidithiobacillus sp.]|uniref:hypothetical protein n=1 Tax=Acidithiobacillus sp. TaxID=1872118 RepID=UPI003D0605C9
MPKIGARFGLSRAWVGKILEKRGIKSTQGGVKFTRARLRALQPAPVVKVVVGPYGLTEKQWNVLTDRTQKTFSTPVLEMARICGVPVVTGGRGLALWTSHLAKLYLRIRTQAKHKHGEYLSFGDWYDVWLLSGHFSRETGIEDGWCLVKKDPDKGWDVHNAQVVRTGIWMSQSGERRA